MFARYLNAPLLLLLWQVAPVGKVRLALGGGQGEFAFQDYPGYPGGMDCTGSYPGRAPYTQSLNYSTRAIAAEAWVSQKLRVYGAFGGVTDFTGQGGTFFAAQGVFEQKYYGLGAGFVTGGGLGHQLQPSASLRIGSLAGASLRADYRFPQAAMGLVGGPRVGVGWNQSGNLKPRLFAGIASTPIPDSARKIGGFVEFAFPLGFLKSGLFANAFVGGKYHGNETRQIYSLGLGAWIQP